MPIDKEELLDFLMSNVVSFLAIAKETDSPAWGVILYNAILDYYLTKSIPEGDDFIFKRISLLERYGVLDARIEQINNLVIH